jgi:hypothetical protein
VVRAQAMATSRRPVPTVRNHMAISRLMAAVMVKRVRRAPSENLLKSAQSVRQATNPTRRVATNLTRRVATSPMRRVVTNPTHRGATSRSRPGEAKVAPRAAINLRASNRQGSSRMGAVMAANLPALSRMQVNPPAAQVVAQAAAVASPQVAPARAATDLHYSISDKAPTRGPLF